jgi:hypothetical protein
VVHVFAESAEPAGAARLCNEYRDKVAAWLEEIAHAAGAGK